MDTRLGVWSGLCSSVGGLLVHQGTLFDGEVEMFHLVFIGPLLAAGGAVAALAALELDFFSGVMHYGIYLLATCLLRWVAGVGVY